VNHKTGIRLIILLVAVALVLGGCRDRGVGADGEVTETIAPAAPQPAPMGADALTQTIDVEDSRSDAEGAGIAPGEEEMVSPVTATGRAPTATTTR
jgi:predicted small secreted protein